MAAAFWLMHALLDAQVLTSQYNNAHTGATLSEIILTPANVSPRQFGKIFSLKVDGDVYAQPLYVPHVEIPGQGAHDLLIVATEHDSVYAFDAEGRPRALLWHINFLSSAVTTVSAREADCSFIRPEIGITPTPAIDAVTGTIYVLACTREDSGIFKGYRFVQKLHALALTTGAEKFGGPVEIRASVKGRGDESSGGAVSFNPLRELPRAGLLLANGSVLLTWGSSCDVSPYHGWVMAYDARTLAQKAVLNTSPDAQQSGVWQSDNAPAADEDGNIYVATGNGDFDVVRGGRDYGDTLLKLNPSLAVRDYFTPFNERQLNADDDDLGSGGPVLLPKFPGSQRRLVLVGGKGGVLYILDRYNLGKFHAGGDSDAVQTYRFRGGIYSAAAYWNQHIYILAEAIIFPILPLSMGISRGSRSSWGLRAFRTPAPRPLYPRTALATAWFG